jgi:DNA-binding transcriptional ArsR family regulator
MIRYAMSRSKLQAPSWRFVKILGNKARVHILQLLLDCEMASLSDIVRALERDHGLKITVSGVFKHAKALEKAGLVRHESGGFLPEPDARKTIYMLEGRKRVARILELEKQMVDLLRTGLVFRRTAELAREVRGIGPGYRAERVNLIFWLDQLEKEMGNLTEDEKEKLRLWRIITASQG